MQLDCSFVRVWNFVLEPKERYDILSVFWRQSDEDIIEP